MPVPAPGQEALVYVISFRLPGGIWPISRAGQLLIFSDGAGTVTIRDDDGSLAAASLPLVPDEIAVCRKVIGFWLAHATPARVPVAS